MSNGYAYVKRNTTDPRRAAYKVVWRLAGATGERSRSFARKDAATTFLREREDEVAGRSTPRDDAAGGITLRDHAAAAMESWIDLRAGSLTLHGGGRESDPPIPRRPRPRRDRPRRPPGVGPGSRTSRERADRRRSRAGVGRESGRRPLPSPRRRGPETSRRESARGPFHAPDRARRGLRTRVAHARRGRETRGRTPRRVPRSRVGRRDRGSTDRGTPRPPLARRRPRPRDDPRRPLDHGIRWTDPRAELRENRERVPDGPDPRTDRPRALGTPRVDGGRAERRFSRRRAEGRTVPDCSGPACSLPPRAARVSSTRAGRRSRLTFSATLCATWWMEDGSSPMLVARWMGHSARDGGAFVVRRYGHVSPTHGDEVVARMDARLDGTAAGVVDLDARRTA